MGCCSQRGSRGPSRVPHRRRAHAARAGSGPGPRSHPRGGPATAGCRRPRRVRDAAARTRPGRGRRHAPAKRRRSSCSNHGRSVQTSASCGCPGRSAPALMPEDRGPCAVRNLLAFEPDAVGKLAARCRAIDSHSPGCSGPHRSKGGASALIRPPQRPVVRGAGPGVPDGQPTPHQTPWRAPGRA
jgi:hypothetical protein